MRPVFWCDNPFVIVLFAQEHACNQLRTNCALLHTLQLLKTPYTRTFLILSNFYPTHFNFVLHGALMYNYSVSQKNPPWDFLTFFPYGWEFLIQILHAYCTFLPTLDYKFLFSYLQLGGSYEVMPHSSWLPSPSYAQNVYPCPKRTLGGHT